MSTQVFPRFDWARFRLSFVHNTLISDGENGIEQRRKKKTNAKTRKRWIISHDVLDQCPTDEDARELWDFFNAHDGRAQSFYFEDPVDFQATGEAVGIGDGSTVQFQLDNFPIKSASETIYVGSPPTAQTKPTQYTINEATGLITFQPLHKPPLNAPIVADYQFFHVARFEEDIATFESFEHQLFRNEMRLRAVAA